MVEINHVGLFPLPSAGHQCLFAGIAPDRSLCELHEKVYRAVLSHCPDVFDFVRPGFMVFHSTLSGQIQNGRIPEAVDILKEIVPLRAKLTEAVIVEYPPAQEKMRFQLKVPSPTPNIPNF